MIHVHSYSDVFRLKGRSTTHTNWQEGIRARDVIILSGMSEETIVGVWINGILSDLDDALKDEDHITWGVVQGWEAIGIAILSSIIGAGISYGISLLLGPPKSFISGAKDETPTYGFRGIGNTAYSGAVIPVVYGLHRVGGQIIQRFTRSNDQGDDTLFMLIMLSHGRIYAIGDKTEDFDNLEGESLPTGIKINSNDLAQYRGVKVSGRLGTPDQTAIVGFNDVTNARDIGVKLVNTSGSDRTGTDDAEAFLISDTGSIQAFEINIAHDGLYKLNDSGGLSNFSVTYRYRYRLHAGPGTWSSWSNVTVQKATRSFFKSTSRFDNLGLDSYDIQVQRVTIDNVKTDRANDITLDSVNLITYDSLNYPGRALLAVEAIATDQLSSSSPTITSLVSGRVIRTPLTGRLATEATTTNIYGTGTLFTTELAPNDSINLNGQDMTVVSILNDVQMVVSVTSSETVSDLRGWKYAWSQNPADVALDAAVNSIYGMGSIITDDNIDFDSYDAFRDYCNEMADTLDGTGQEEVRCRFDGVFDTETSAWEAIQQICRGARTMAVQSGSLIKFSVMREREVTQLFTDGSIEPDSLEISYLSKYDRPNFVTAQFANELLDYEMDAASLPDPTATRDGSLYRTKSVRLVGVTRLSQAMREAAFMTNVNQAIITRISFDTAIDALAAEVGDIIEIANNLPAWGKISGRILSADTQSVTLDKTLSISDGIQYYVRVRHTSDALETRPLDMEAGVYAPGTELRLGEAWTAVPDDYSNYTVGEDERWAKPFEITSITLTPEFKRHIEAQEYVPEVYSDTAVTIPRQDYSYLEDPGTIPGPVQNLRADVRVETDTFGTKLQVVDLTWTRPADEVPVQWYLVFLRETSTISFRQYGSPVNATKTTITGLDQNLAYDFTVVAVSPTGDRMSEYNTPVVSVYLGTAAPPPPPPDNLVIVSDGGNTYHLEWDAVVDWPDLKDYEVRVTGLSDEDSILLEFIPQGTGTLSSSVFELPPAESVQFRVRSRNFAGRRSASVSTDTEASVGDVSGKAVANTTTFGYGSGWSSGSFTNLTETSGKLELTDETANGGVGVWTSPFTIIGATVASTEFNLQFECEVKQADAIIAQMLFTFNSLEADPWKLGNLYLPPYPDNVIEYAWEIRTSAENVASSPNVALFTAWTPMDLISGLVATARWYQVRVTLTYRASNSNSDLYEPRAVGLRVVQSR